MNCELLLEWMTHLGSGPWAAFRDTVDEIRGTEDRIEQDVYRSVRIALSDLGHADFFLGSSRHWRVRRPALAALSDRTRHIFIGGRTRALTEKLAKATSEVGALTTMTEETPGLLRVLVEGDPNTLRSVSADLAIQYLPQAAAQVAANLPRIGQMIETATKTSEPVNWMVRSWSFDDRRWIPDRMNYTVREYANRHGIRRYLLSTGRFELREVERRASIYCAAFIRGDRFACYSCSDRCLRVPRWAPLPEVYARTACLAGGLPAAVQGGELVFRDVEPAIALTLLVALGQGFPKFETQP
jgi:hypothetical protein